MDFSHLVTTEGDTNTVRQSERKDTKNLCWMIAVVAELNQKGLISIFLFCEEKSTPVVLATLVFWSLQPKAP